MSVEWMSQVWKHAELDGSSLLLLLAIADHANAEGYCWPSVPTLAKQARLSERQTQRVLVQLEKAGYIRRENKGGRGNHSYYYLQDVSGWGQKGDTQPSPFTPQKDGGGGAERVTSRVSEMTKGDTEGVKGDTVTHTRDEPSLEPSITTEPSENHQIAADAATTADADGVIEGETWGEFLNALCWVCHGHMELNMLTADQMGILTSEGKRIWNKGEGYTIDELREWFKDVWRKRWQWKKNEQRPLPSEVRSNIATVRDKQRVKDKKHESVVEGDDYETRRKMYVVG